MAAPLQGSPMMALQSVEFERQVAATLRPAIQAAIDPVRQAVNAQAEVAIAGMTQKVSNSLAERGCAPLGNACAQTSDIVAKATLKSTLDVAEQLAKQAVDKAIMESTRRVVPYIIAGQNNVNG